MEIVCPGTVSLDCMDCDNTLPVFMACNTPPSFANVDNAVIARCQYVPFESSFADDAPMAESLQFEKLIFKADRDFNSHRVQFGFGMNDNGWEPCRIRHQPLVVC